jgi:GTPase SAR1 family protein
MAFFFFFKKPFCCPELTQYVSYYHGALGALITYDITSEESFRNVEKWLKEVRQHSDPNIILMLVRCATERERERENVVSARIYLWL